MSELTELTEALAANMEIIRALSQRIELLERPVEENAARQIAVMTLLRSMCECAPNREQLLSLVERKAAQIQAQPGYVLHGNSDNFRKMKAHLDWMTGQA